MFECLKVSQHTAVDWHLFYNEDCCNWLGNQEAIGGAGVEVKINDTNSVEKVRVADLVVWGYWVVVEKTIHRCSSIETSDLSNKETTVPMTYIVPIDYL